MMTACKATSLITLAQTLTPVLLYMCKQISNLFCFREQSHEGGELQMCSGVLHKGHRPGPEERRVLLQQVLTTAQYHTVNVLHLTSVVVNLCFFAGLQLTVNWETTQRRLVTAREPSGSIRPTAKRTAGWGESYMLFST